MKLCLMFKESIGVFPEIFSNHTVTSTGERGREEDPLSSALQSVGEDALQGRAARPTWREQIPATTGHSGCLWLDKFTLAKSELL